MNAAPELMLVLGDSERRRRTRNTNRGRKFPPDPIRTDEFALLLEHCVPLMPGRYGYLSALRLRTLLVILFRGGLRISEALDLYEFDLNRSESALVVRHGKGDKRRVVLMDEWAWQQVDHWLGVRAEIPAGALLPVLRGRTAGRPMNPADVRRQMVQLRERAGLRRRVHPHAFRHGFAVSARQENIDLYALQKALGHVRLDVTARYLAGINPMEVLRPFALRQPPMVSVPSATRSDTSGDWHA